MWRLPRVAEVQQVWGAGEWCAKRARAARQFATTRPPLLLTKVLPWVAVQHLEAPHISSQHRLTPLSPHSVLAVVAARQWYGTARL